MSPERPYSVTQGEVHFRHPRLPSGSNCMTWFCVLGDLKADRRPLVALHGGPGVPHNYILPTFHAFVAATGTPVVLYDQLGCGNSTRLPQTKHDEELWTVELFVAELDNLLKHLDIARDFDLYGQSWGAMLAASFAISTSESQKGLRKLVLGSGPCSIEQWRVSMQKLLTTMSPEVQDAIREAEAASRFNTSRYQEAVQIFYYKYMCCLDPWPSELAYALGTLEVDDTVYMTMWGPSEINPIGNLSNFDMTEDCKSITAPTLLINGEHDEAQANCLLPWFEGIPNVQWVTMPGCSHCAHLEDVQKYVALLSSFLQQ